MAPPIEFVADPCKIGDVFEGPEKKLEVFFTTSTTPDGFRSFDQGTWSELLLAAKCSILHRQSNEHFDAYLLSESSLFVYPSRVILKTCGTTSLLLALPQMLILAKRLNVIVEHVHYGHYRYKFPTQQLYPHASFDQERDYLSSTFGSVESRVIGSPDGQCWYALCSQQSSLQGVPPMRREGDDIFEMAMEDLAPQVCEQFHDASFPNLSGRALAQHMTETSGIGALLPDVIIDDWAFEPCGYSMNGLRGSYYYTIHITPEEGFSYASFETNDPKYRDPKWVQAVASVFRPAVLTATLTTRGVSSELPAFSITGLERSSHEIVTLVEGISMCCINFSAGSATEDGVKRYKRCLNDAPSPTSSLSTAELASFDSETSNSEASSVVGDQLDGQDCVVGGTAEEIIAA